MVLFVKGGNLSENQRHQLAAAAFWNFQGGEWKKRVFGPIEPPPPQRQNSHTRDTPPPDTKAECSVHESARLHVLLPVLLAPPPPVPLAPPLAEWCEKLISTICFAARTSAILMLPSRFRAEKRAFTRRSDGSCKGSDRYLYVFFPSGKTSGH